MGPGAGQGAPRRRHGGGCQRRCVRLLLSGPNPATTLQVFRSAPNFLRTFCPKTGVSTSCSSAPSPTPSRCWRCPSGVARPQSGACGGITREQKRRERRELLDTSYEGSAGLSTVWRNWAGRKKHLLVVGGAAPADALRRRVPKPPVCIREAVELLTQERKITFWPSCGEELIPAMGCSSPSPWPTPPPRPGPAGGSPEHILAQCSGKHDQNALRADPNSGGMIGIEAAVALGPSAATPTGHGSAGARHPGAPGPGARLPAGQRLPGLSIWTRTFPCILSSPRPPARILSPWKYVTATPICTPSRKKWRDHLPGGRRPGGPAGGPQPAEHRQHQGVCRPGPAGGHQAHL